MYIDYQSFDTGVCVCVR